MPQTQIACPNCRQMIAANIEQLFDVTQDPQAKQRLLGGVSNMARCPHCGFQGRLATPIIYHDNEKELLLTFFPPELNVPLQEQEKIIGPLIKKITDSLPAGKRKGYLLSPSPNLTFESMIKVILGKDGVTPEMLKAQQDRVQIVERLIQASSADVSVTLKFKWRGRSGRDDKLKRHGAILAKLLSRFSGGEEELSVQTLAHVGLSRAVMNQEARVVVRIGGSRVERGTRCRPEAPPAPGRPHHPVQLRRVESRSSE